jgi:hypothetical protein
MGCVVKAMPWSLYPRERPGSHCIGGRVGPGAGLDRGGKSRLSPGFDLRTVQPVASRYTDYATPPTLVNLLAPEFYIYILAHSVCKI